MSTAIPINQANLKLSMMSTLNNTRCNNIIRWDPAVQPPMGRARISSTFKTRYIMPICLLRAGTSMGGYLHLKLKKCLKIIPYFQESKMKSLGIRA
jgi:hypothetical protein